MSNDIISEAVRNNSGAWWETHGRIANKAGEVVTVMMNHLQVTMESVRLEFVRRVLPIRIIQLKPRQKGSTTYSTGLCYHTLRRKRTAACVIGGQYSQTKKAWEMMKLYLKLDSFDWKGHGTINEERGTFSNGSMLEPETAKDFDAGRSGTLQFLLATEVARWAQEGAANAKAVLAGLLKCVPPLPDTVVVLESTAKGASGDFYTRWLNALDAEEFLAGAELKPGQYVRVFAAWFQFEDSAVRLTDEQKRRIEATVDAEPWYLGEQELIATYGHRGEDGVWRLGSVVTGCDGWEQLAWRRWALEEECSKDIDDFNEDYPESWEKAFLHSGRLRFNRHGLKAMKARAATREMMPALFEEQRVKNRFVLRAVAKEEAKFWVWERPLPGRRYLVSVDTMTGASQVGGKDPDCHSVLVHRAGYFESGRGWTRPAVVARIAPPCRWDIDVLERAVWALACYYGGQSACMIVPEVNMDRGLIELLKLRGANVYVRTFFNKREFKETDAHGWLTSPATREMSIDGLAKAIREWDKDGEGIDLWCPHLLEECGNFVVKENGRSEASDGHHDDDVMSCAIGRATIGSATVYTEPVFVRPLPADLQKAEERALRGGRGRSQYS